MNCKKNLFTLDPGTVYLNGAYMSPLLKSSEEAGIRGLLRKRNPSNFRKVDFFDSVDKIRTLFGRLINAHEDERVVIVPSAAYALANVARNIRFKPGQNIVILQDQFPSNFYIWQRVASEYGAGVKIIPKPKETEISWSERVLDSIDDRTAVVSMPQFHWGDGTYFDLEKISRKIHEKDGLLIVDGTQSIGAFPFDQQKIQADAIVVSAYKWLLGPYGIGLSYYGPSFDQGFPIEESWLNRVNSDDFQFLTDYQDEYRDKARRYEMGEAPDFIKIPMLESSINQLLDWGQDQIQLYCKSIVEPIIQPLLEHGYSINTTNMGYHLFGIVPPESLSMDDIKAAVTEAKISVSYRRDVIRTSPYVHNTLKDTILLKDVLINLIKIS